jgi:5'-nucleotidase
MPHILLTNDDGIHAEGLRSLAEALADLGTLSIVAPHRERSAAAQSISLRHPIICDQRGEREWAVDGTPADAVIVALHKLLPEPPDLVISGINRGANLGENVYYSGTVGAAREATIYGLPAFAVSVVSRGKDYQFADAARFARSLAQVVLKEGLPNQVLLNVNVPQPWQGGVRFVRQSRKITRNQLQEGTDPRGRRYFWLHEQQRDQDIEPETDYAAIAERAIAVTPLHLDPTHTQSLNHLSHWAGKLEHSLQNR